MGQWSHFWEIRSWKLGGKTDASWFFLYFDLAPLKLVLNYEKNNKDLEIYCHMDQNNDMIMIQEKDNLG